MKTDIKPLSVNRAWQGKRFKTPEYKAYEKEALLKLPSNVIIPDGELHVYFCFGVSNMQSDIDNPVKPFLDILQKKYNFNDNRIISMTLNKVKTKKGEEFVEFEIIEGKSL